MLNGLNLLNKNKNGETFVGREKELLELHQALDLVISLNEPKLVLIQGEFGVGKTELVNQFIGEVLRKHDNVLIGCGKCSQKAGDSGYVPFIHLIKNLLEEGLRGKKITSNLRLFLKNVAPAWLDVITGGVLNAGVKTVKEGAKLMGYSIFTEENMLIQFTNTIKRIAQKQPLIAFVDDLQWADESSLGLLFHLIRYLNTCAVLLTCTYRPVEAMETGKNAALFNEIRANLIRYGATELEINRGIDVDIYLGKRYPNNTFSSKFLAHVQGKTGGHALFVSLLFSLWEDTGVIAPVPLPDGRLEWKLVKDVDKFPPIPPIQGVLDERVRIIEEELREILVHASVEGDDFTAQVIANLCTLDEYKAFQGLEALEHRYRLIKESGKKEISPTVVYDFYRFVQRFFREHVYGQLSEGRRRILHRRVGECIEALYSEKYDVAGQLALHFREAQELDKAASYALMASEFEMSRYCASEAKSWCLFGLGLLEPASLNEKMAKLRFSLLEQLGYVYYVSGQLVEAELKYQQALTFAHQMMASAKHIAGLYEKLADICLNQLKYKQAMSFLEQGKHILKDSNIPMGETHLRLDAIWGWIQTRLGNNDIAIKYIREALNQAKNLPRTAMLERSRAIAYNALGLSLSSLNRYSKALSAFEKSTEIASKINDRRLEATYLLNSAFTYFCLGELTRALSYTNRGLEIAELIGELDAEAFGKANRGIVLLALGKPKKSLKELELAIALSEQIGSFWNMPCLFADLAMAYLALGDKEMAYQQAKSGVFWAQKGDSHFQLGYTLDALGQVAAARQDLKQAASCFDQAVIHHRQAGDRHFEARVYCHQAELLVQLGEQGNAIEKLKAALIFLEELELKDETAKARGLLKKLEKPF